ncbi:MAG: 4a-hydroxytetrahydrobiopterin dehydratase [Pseudomonadota bacterium]|nr:4a-hydroxytetrahydrobiopterin dehydratase [Pseudomonadota bacterium]
MRPTNETGARADASRLHAMAAIPGSPGAARLPESAVRHALDALTGWTFSQDALQKTFTFADYAGTIAFVNAIAWIAQRLDHHPDLHVGFDRCLVVWTTHDAKGVTDNDCVAAARTELLLS